MRLFGILFGVLLVLAASAVAPGCGCAAKAAGPAVAGNVRVGGVWYNRLADGTLSYCAECNRGLPAPAAPCGCPACPAGACAAPGACGLTTCGGFAPAAAFHLGPGGTPARCGQVRGVFLHRLFARRSGRGR